MGFKKLIIAGLITLAAGLKRLFGGEAKETPSVPVEK